MSSDCVVFWSFHMTVSGWIAISASFMMELRPLFFVSVDVTLSWPVFHRNKPNTPPNNNNGPETQGQKSFGMNYHSSMSSSLLKQHNNSLLVFWLCRSFYPSMFPTMADCHLTCGVRQQVSNTLTVLVHPVCPCQWVNLLPGKAWQGSRQVWETMGLSPLAKKAVLSLFPRCLSPYSYPQFHWPLTSLFDQQETGSILARRCNSEWLWALFFFFLIQKPTKNKLVQNLRSWVSAETKI